MTYCYILKLFFEKVGCVSVCHENGSRKLVTILLLLWGCGVLGVPNSELYISTLCIHIIMLTFYVNK